MYPRITFLCHRAILMDLPSSFWTNDLRGTVTGVRNQEINRDNPLIIYYFCWTYKPVNVLVFYMWPYQLLSCSRISIFPETSSLPLNVRSHSRSCCFSAYKALKLPRGWSVLPEFARFQVDGSTGGVFSGDFGILIHWKLLPGNFHTKDFFCRTLIKPTNYFAKKSCRASCCGKQFFQC